MIIQLFFYRILGNPTKGMGILPSAKSRVTCFADLCR
jgi:hypothetical protein